MKSNVTQADFRAYLEVQKSGEYNMFDDRARIAAGLSEDVYSNIKRDYGLLIKLYPKTYEEVMKR